MITVGELRAQIEGKADDCQVQVVLNELHMVGGQVSYSCSIAFKDAVVEEKAEEVVAPEPEAENATEVTTEATADAPVSE